MFGTVLNTSMLAVNPNKARLFEGTFFWGGATWNPPLPLLSPHMHTLFDHIWRRPNQLIQLVQCWAGLHETRSELKSVWDFTSGQNSTSVWGNFIISVHMTLGGVKLTSVQIWLRWNWPKWNFKPQWVFHVNSKCPQWNKVAQNH